MASGSIVHIPVIETSTLAGSSPLFPSSSFSPTSDVSQETMAAMSAVQAAAIQINSFFFILHFIKFI